MAYVTLYRYLFIFKRLIFESRVRAGRPSLAAAPFGPEIWPWLKLVRLQSFASLAVTKALLSVRVRLSVGGGSRFSQISSTENVSPSARMTARSITFWSSRTFPGQPYA